MTFIHPLLCVSRKPLKLDKAPKHITPSQTRFTKTATAQSAWTPSSAIPLEAQVAEKPLHPWSDRTSGNCAICCAGESESAARWVGSRTKPDSYAQANKCDTGLPQTDPTSPNHLHRNTKSFSAPSQGPSSARSGGLNTNCARPTSHRPFLRSQ